MSRCLYNALNDRIRNLLLSYDYSKSSDPLQPLAFHLTSLLTRETPETADISIATSAESFRLHKFILSARSPYFSKKLQGAPETTTWKLPPTIPPQAFGIAIKYLYLGELPRDLGGGPGTGFTDSEVFAGIDKISKHLEIQNLSQLILDSGDRRLARQRRADEVEKGRDQLEGWFSRNVLQHAVVTDADRADEVKWDRDNAIFADVLLRADEEEDEAMEESNNANLREINPSNTNALGIPLDSQQSQPTSPTAPQSRRSRRSTLFPCHRAMLIRSEFFLTMFSSSFREAQHTPHLQIIPIACTPAVLEIILTFLYTERADFPLNIAVDVLFAADLLFLEKLKMRAAVVISTLGNGNATAIPTTTDFPREDAEEEEEQPIDIYEILHTAWLTRVQRLEEFAARYIAYRLESFIDEPDFAEIVKESAGRISARQETDSIELLDDIRWYLSERFRLRFEDSGLEDMMDEEQQPQGQEEEGGGQERERENLPIAHWGSGPMPEQQRQSTHDDEAIDMRTPNSLSASAGNPLPSRSSPHSRRRHCGRRICQRRHQLPDSPRQDRSITGEAQVGCLI
jgi:ankyrin repeat and BTB/POZ domain-containing protein 1